MAVGAGMVLDDDAMMLTRPRVEESDGESAVTGGSIRRSCVAAAAVQIALLVAAVGCSPATSPSQSSNIGPTSAATHGSSSLPSAGASGRVAADLFTAPPNLLNVNVTTENASAVADSIGPDGGQLSTKAADGTTYTLEIPPGAVLFAEDISMTPVVGVGGLPGDTAPAHVVGVRLAPDGFELYAPATLTITPPSPLPVAGVATMGFKGDGADAGLVLFDQHASDLTVHVEHFSGYTSFWPLDEEWWRRGERIRQEKAAERLQNELAAFLGLIRQKQMVGIDDGFTLADLVSSLVAGWEAEILAPLRQNAANGCREASDAIAAYVAWERQLQLLGVSLSNLSPEEYTKATDEQRTLYEKVRRDIPPDLLVLKRDLCFEEQFQRCRQTGDFEHLMGFFLSYFRQLEVLGQDVSGDDVELAHLYLERCGRWTLVIESIEDLKAPGGSSALVHQTRTYSIKWRPGDAGVYGLVATHAIGDGTTEIVGVAVSEVHCVVTDTYQGTTPPDSAEITGLKFDQPQDAAPVPRKVDLGLTFGSQSWSRVETCNNGPQSTEFSSVGGYVLSLIALKDPFNTREWRFDAGPLGEGPFSAKMTVTATIQEPSVPPVTIDVEMIITLDHTPST
jgi:hypothetical protein